MKTENSQFSLGIDLGTTNCALASFDHQDEQAEKATSFEIPQLIDQTVVDARTTLPSFSYQPADQEKEIFKLPWDSEPARLAGLYAREQGEKTPQRLVTSAKSWLCVPDGRQNRVLPLAAAEGVDKISAVDASASYLAHLKAAWDQTHDKSLLENQEVVITVPASFDVVARDLTVEAAKHAGIEKVTLLEEPIAAFYAWLADHQDTWRDVVNVGDVVLVCDIGGGTTDFSLISVEEEDGNLALTRIAVGEHILLGGDNMDLAIARTVQMKMESEGKKLEQWQFFGLAHSCRKAKETLLSDPSLDKVSVVIPGRGSKLIGGTRSSELTRAEIESTLLDGFFGECAATDMPALAKRTGLRTFGLNYASDSAILKHLAKFLTDAKKYIDPKSDLATTTEGRGFLHPTSILFNGGVTKAGIFQDRVVKVVNQWLTDDGGEAAKTLSLGDQDLAVSLGAAYYGGVCRGKGVRIKSASVFPYYIGVESAMPAIPGMPPLMNGLCVVPVGMEEGTNLQIPGSEFHLVVGETVDFRFFIGRDRPQDAAGNLVENAPDQLEELTTLEVTLPRTGGLTEEQSTIPVRLRAVLTELGSLELWCDAVDSDQSWKLEFNIRED